MSDSLMDKDSPIHSAREASGERVVYVMPERGSDDELSLRDLWDVLWSGKWVIIATTALFAVVSVAYAFLAAEWYRSTVLLAPAEDQSTSAIAGQLGGLAALAGVSIGDGSSAEAIAFLNSREFAREFVDDFHLLPMFFHDQWDAASRAWIGNDPDEWPDVRDGVEYFHEEVLNVSEARDTGLVTLAIEWTNPDVAAEWANELVVRLNERLRIRALREAETNVAYLQSELAQTSVITLQQTIGRLLESELQKLMLARGTEEFAFRVIDPASPPKERVRPKRALIAVLGTVLGGMIAVAYVLLSQGIRGQTKPIAPETRLATSRDRP